MNILNRPSRLLLVLGLCSGTASQLLAQLDYAVYYDLLASADGSSRYYATDPTGSSYSGSASGSYDSATSFSYDYSLTSTRIELSKSLVDTYPYSFVSGGADFQFDSPSILSTERLTFSAPSGSFDVTFRLDYSLTSSFSGQLYGGGNSSGSEAPYAQFFFDLGFYGQAVIGTLSANSGKLYFGSPQTGSETVTLIINPSAPGYGGNDPYLDLTGSDFFNFLVVAQMGYNSFGSEASPFYEGTSLFDLSFEANLYIESITNGASFVGAASPNETFALSSVPEPSTYVLWFAGLIAGFAIWRRRRIG